MGTALWSEQDHKSATDAQGWFDTGDVATINPDSYMQIRDRSKDVVKSGGEWISSIDLENVAVGHPEVIEVRGAGCCAGCCWSAIPRA